jgi:hypothetical protein
MDVGRAIAGFGLTVLEAMYKRVPVIGTAQALGISSQSLMA